MIYFFYGEESWHGWHAVKKMREDFSVNNGGAKPIIFDCDEEVNVAEIFESFGVQDLFAQKKMIVLRNFLVNTKSEEQKKIIESIEKTEDDVVVWEESSPRKNGAMYKWLIKNADKSQEGKKLEGADLNKWIENFVNKNNSSISANAVRELIVSVGNDLWRLENETAKLIAYADDREISINDVHILVHGKIHADMFEAIESVTRGNVAHALHLLKKQIAKGDEAFHIFSMYGYQVRTLLLVGGAMDAVGTDRTAIAKTVKIHPFVAQKSIAVIQNIGIDRAKKMHKLLAKLDFEVKNGMRGVDDALDYFVINA